MVAMKALSNKLKTQELNVSSQDTRIGTPNQWTATSPYQLAEVIASRLRGKIDGIETVQAVRPGFINFTLSRDFFVEKITGVLASADTWGRNESWKGKKVLVEYTDPNPFKEFHIGHLFTNTVGESIARLFMMSGADTKRVNYGSDVGLHVAHALWGMRELGITAESAFTARDLGRAYAHGATAYKNEDPRAVQEIRDINKKIYEKSDSVLNTLYDKGREVSIAYFKGIYRIIDSDFDAQFFESEVAGPGKEVVLMHPELFPESDGAHVFEGEQYGLHTRVFLNKEGLPTYEAKELALAKLKEERLGTYDHSVISTANEITEYFRVLKKAMSFIYPELEAKTEHIGHGMVKLATGKMSSRTGNVIPALDFIDEVADMAAAKMDEGGKVAPTEELARDIALGAIRYTILRGSILQDSVFDKDKALSFEGDSGPYLQYTHARIVSVLDKAKGVGVVLDTKAAPETPYAIEKILYRFPEVVRDALTERAPHKVAVFLTELAGAFNTFYGEEKIADASDENAPYKAAIADAVRITLKNGLWALGIKAPDKM
jgi:arginyl-tRNA synthetase